MRWRCAASARRERRQRRQSRCGVLSVESGARVVEWDLSGGSFTVVRRGAERTIRSARGRRVASASYVACRGVASMLAVAGWVFYFAKGYLISLRSDLGLGSRFSRGFSSTFPVRCPEFRAVYTGYGGLDPRSAVGPREIRSESSQHLVTRPPAPLRGPGRSSL